MSTYELTVLLANEEDMESVTTLLSSLSAKIINEKKWGKLKLAYPIQKQSAAHYITLMVDVENKNVAELKKKLNFNEKLLRYLILHREEK